PKYFSCSSSHHNNLLRTKLLLQIHHEDHSALVSPGSCHPRHRIHTPDRQLNSGRQSRCRCHPSHPRRRRQRPRHLRPRLHRGPRRQLRLPRRPRIPGPRHLRRPRRLPARHLHRRLPPRHDRRAPPRRLQMRNHGRLAHAHGAAPPEAEADGAHARRAVQAPQPVRLALHAHRQLGRRVREHLWPRRKLYDVLDGGVLGQFCDGEVYRPWSWCWESRGVGAGWRG
ncbi:hypothetical protein EDC01DRAFT_747569, partial [Geopyxis carbonaria]